MNFHKFRAEKEKSLTVLVAIFSRIPDRGYFLTLFSIAKYDVKSKGKCNDRVLAIALLT